MPRSNPILILFAVVTAACSSREAPESFIGAITTLEAPAGPLSGEPNLAVDAKGRLYLSWLERKADSTTALHLSVRDGESWSTPATVTSGRDLFVNWADFPSVYVAPSGRIVMHWLQKQARGKYSYDVMTRQSTDGGVTWSAPRMLHDDNVAAEHGFVSFFAADG